MLELIDKLAGRWLDFRTDMESKKNPVFNELELERVELDNDGLHIIGSSPAVAILADEAAKMLNAANAKNYLEFDMMPRIDRGLKPIRVTVQWAYGLSPSQKAAMLQDFAEKAINLYPDLENMIDEKLLK